jgi:hypothetical protein
MSQSRNMSIISKTRKFDNICKKLILIHKLLCIHSYLNVKKSLKIPKRQSKAVSVRTYSVQYTNTKIRNTLLKKAQSLNIKVDKDYKIVHERRMT